MKTIVTWVILLGLIALLATPLKGFVSDSGQELEILSYHIQSLVISRYAISVITCKIRNPTMETQEAVFSVLLPQNAFISNLTIEAGGKNYTSLVKEKEEARATYEKAKMKGKNAALAFQKERDTTRFRIDVSIASQTEIIVYLSYEELLQRRLGAYSHVINVHPTYVVRNVMVDVTIHETRVISFLEVTKVPGSDSFRSAVSEWREGAKTARIQFDPNLAEMADKGEILHGQLVVRYDVKRALDAGDVQMEDGYFVHFFAPVDLQYTPKHITFLIDTSGSMEGTKLSQVKEAMKRILKDMHKGDTFAIVTFASSAERLITARYSNFSVKKAMKYVNGLEADGATNIDEGLKVALSRHRPPPPARLYARPVYEDEPVGDALQWCTVEGRKGDKKGALDLLPVSFTQNIDTGSDAVTSYIVVLLTDGRPTAGVTYAHDILENVRKRNKHGASIFCLGFGEDVDMSLLETLSLQNGGTWRKIYEDLDAADQLKSFYEELSTPVLLDVKFAYSKDAVILDSLTNSHFENYFKGKELTVAGRIRGSVSDIRANITGQGRNGDFFMGVTDWNTVFPPDWHLLGHLQLGSMPKKFIKRLWAFLRVKNLLNKSKAAYSKQEQQLAERQALHIALQWHFVTPLTSLVVVQPELEECKDYDDDDKEEDTETDDEEIRGGSGVSDSSKNSEPKMEVSLDSDVIATSSGQENRAYGANSINKVGKTATTASGLSLACQANVLLICASFLLCRYFQATSLQSCRLRVVSASCLLPLSTNVHRKNTTVRENNFFLHPTKIS